MCCFTLLITGEPSIGFSATKATASLQAALSVAETDKPTVVLEPEFHIKTMNDPISIEAGAKGSLDLVNGTELSDVLAETTLTATAHPGADMKLVVDAGYTFDRDYDDDFSPNFAAIDVEHDLSGTVTVEKSFDEARLTFDLGARSVLHEDLVRIGISPFDRKAQDYIAPEIAARLAFFPKEEVHPFIEAALVGRHYFQDRDILGRKRDYWGPEMIAGIEVETQRFSAQFAAIYAWADHSETGVTRQSVLGPYIDFTWRPDDTHELIFAAASSLAQESSGAVSAYPVHAAHVEVTTALTDMLELSSVVEFKYEDFAGPGGTLTITPEIGAQLMVKENIALIGALSGEWVTSTGAADAFSASAKIGMKFNFN